MFKFILDNLHYVVILLVGFMLSVAIIFAPPTVVQGEVVTPTIIIQCPQAEAYPLDIPPPFNIEPTIPEIGEMI